MISVVTPSFRQLEWLKLALASVDDQQGVEVEHIIQDAGTPEIEKWFDALSSQPGNGSSRTKLYVEADDGMYDAINRGLRRASGDICAYLNCDEQFLPGTLRLVQDIFVEHAEVDMVIGNTLIVDHVGKLLAFRKVTPLRRQMILTDHFYALTCGIFFRRQFIERGLLFNPEFRVAGDAEWISRALAAGIRIQYLREYVAAFAVTGANLSSPELHAVDERRRLLAMACPLAQRFRSVLRALRHLEKLVNGAYFSGPVSYSIYTGADTRTRKNFRCGRPSPRHPWA